MLIVAPDFARRIDLPGAGACPRPIDIDRARSGLAKLVSLRVYSFAAGMVIDGEAEGDEVFIVLLRGAARIGVDQAGTRVDEFALARDGGVRAVYLPPHAAYRLSAQADCDIAYARVEPATSPLPPPRGFALADGRVDVPDHATAMRLTLATFDAGERLIHEADATERFVHVRSDDDGTIRAGADTLGDWDAAILADGEPVTFAVEAGQFDILTVSATQR